jgi:hypothetical protein
MPRDYTQTAGDYHFLIHRSDDGTLTATKTLVDGSSPPDEVVTWDHIPEEVRRGYFAQMSDAA